MTFSKMAIVKIPAKHHENVLMEQLFSKTSDIQPEFLLRTKSITVVFPKDLLTVQKRHYFDHW